jgi:hypothetical protein
MYRLRNSISFITENVPQVSGKAQGASENLRDGVYCTFIGCGMSKLKQHFLLDPDVVLWQH